MNTNQQFHKEILAVAEFNRTNSGFRIEINDYSKFNQNYTDNASFDKLNLDIASGKIPDIVIGGNSIDTVHFSRMGMFADLNEFLETDSELNKDDFFTGITDLFSADGKLYRLPLSIYLNAAICREDLPGKENFRTRIYRIDYLFIYPLPISTFFPSNANPYFTIISCDIPESVR